MISDFSVAWILSLQLADHLAPVSKRAIELPDRQHRSCDPISAIMFTVLGKAPDCVSYLK